MILAAQVLRTLANQEYVNVGPLMLVQELRLSAIMEVAKVRMTE